MYDFSNNTVIITGGTSGIGMEIAKQFVKNNANVIILGTNKDRKKTALKELESQKKQENQKILAYLVDVSKKDQVNKVLETILKEFTNIDILINCAGITKDSLLMKMKEEDWDRVIDVNLKSIYNTCHSLIRPMMKNKKGKIINIASVVGIIGNAGQANYSAAKAGMIGFTKTLAKEVASRGINVNAIAPGFIETKMTDKIPTKNKDDLLEKIPMKKLGKTEDIANACLFLASEMSGYITGQTLVVDGGMTI